MDELTKELIQVAASLATGCTSCLEYHVPRAKKLGAKASDLQEVLKLVRPVKLNATLKVDEFATNLFSQNKPELKVVNQGLSCGCGSSDCC